MSLTTILHPIAVLNWNNSGFSSAAVVRPRVWMRGPWERSMRAAGLERRPVADVFPESAKYHRDGGRLWVYDFEEDVRERVLEELRPGVFAQWADARERIGA